MDNEYFVGALEELISMVEKDQFQGAINEHGAHRIMLTTDRWDRGMVIQRARLALDLYRDQSSVGDLLEGGKENE